MASVFLERANYALIIRLLLTVAWIVPTSAKSHLENVPLWARGKYFLVSTNAPVLRRMQTTPNFNRSVLTILDHISNVESTVLSSLRPQSPHTTTHIPHCNVLDEPFAKPVKGVFRLRGWPKPDVACVTDILDVSHVQGHSKYSIDHLFNTLADYLHSIDTQRAWIVKNIVKRWPGQSLLAEWRTQFAHTPIFWSRQGMNCYLTHIGAIRLNSLWYLSLGISNFPPFYHLPLYNRQYLTEFIHIDPTDRNTHAANQTMAVFNASSTKGPVYKNASTIFVRLRGDISPSSFVSIYPEHNPAIQESMDKASHNIQQVIDALSPSVLSLLFLPVTLTLIPISLISQVDSGMMLVYMLMSDVLTVVPLATKGFELIHISLMRHRTIATRVTTSLTGKKGAGAAAELWTAECQAEDHVLPCGIAFVLIALVFMVGGVVLELWAKSFVARRIKERKYAIDWIRIGDFEDYDSECYVASMQSTTPSSLSSVATKRSLSENRDSTTQ